MENTLRKSNRMDTKKMVVLAMMTAIAYVAVFIFRIPVVLFLKYEPKDVIITIGGFMFGPLASMLMSAVVSLVEMVTISSTGPIGALMNFLSTVSFSCTAAIVYKKVHTIKGAVIGLVTGSIVMVGVMLAWNYLITPIYMETPREAVAEMLVPVFLPFNLLKAVLNSAITMLLYKPLSTVMRKAHVLPETTSAPTEGSHIKRYAFVYVIAAFLIATCAAVIYFWNK
ncbi:MAG: ECF transporter S component [Oscillospiraceae bacterium]|nr:ECF transporter S component [Oscillospiraceae bacterium]